MREVPITQRLELIVAGEGQLWTLSDDGHTLSFVNEATQEMHSRTLDASCGELADPSGVVSSQMLWLSCNGRISAYTPTGGGHKVPAPRSTQLLASSDGVWALVDNSLIGIGGAAAGRHISIPAKGEARLWQSSGDEAWAIDLNSLNKALIRVQLPSGTSSTFPVPTEGDQIDDFTIGTEDIWVALRDKHFCASTASNLPGYSTNSTCKTSCHQTTPRSLSPRPTPQPGSRTTETTRQSSSSPTPEPATNPWAPATAGSWRVGRIRAAGAEPKRRRRPFFVDMCQTPETPCFSLSDLLTTSDNGISVARESHLRL